MNEFANQLNKEIKSLQDNIAAANNNAEAEYFTNRLAEARVIQRMYYRCSYYTPQFSDAEDYCDVVQCALEEAYER